MIVYIFIKKDILKVETCGWKVWIYLLYCDDNIINAAPSDTMNNIKNIFNLLHARLQFTWLHFSIEISTQGRNWII